MRSALFARCLVPALLFTSAALALTSAALAQPENATALAEALFREANALAQAGNLGEACPKFLASHKADPSYGAVLNYGECEKQLGKTASAWSAFLEAAGLAQKQGESARFADASARAKAIEPKLVRLVIAVKGPTQGLSVQRDGQLVEPVVLGVPVPVDPGEHAITASAPGKKAFSTSVKTVTEGQTVTVEIPPLEGAEAALPPTTGVPSPSASVRPDTSLGTQRSIAIAAAALGLAGVGAGAGLGVAAKSKWDAVSAQCDAGGHCATAGAVSTGNDARSLATGSTVGFVAGGVAAAGAIVLWLTAPKAAPPPSKPVAALSGFAGPEGGGLVLSGRF